MAADGRPTLLGTHWVRAVMQEHEVRTDWVHWIGELDTHYKSQLAQEENVTKLRWLQGKLQALDDITAFMSAAIEQLGIEQNAELDT